MNEDVRDIFRATLFEVKSTISDADEMMSLLDKAVRKHFPKSSITVRMKRGIGSPTLLISFAVAGSKAEVANGIMDNDISYTSIFIDGVTKDGALSDKMAFDPVRGGSITVKSTGRRMARGALKVGLRKKTGSPESIVKHTDNYFKKLRKMIDDNKDKLLDTHRALLKSV